MDTYTQNDVKILRSVSLLLCLFIFLKKLILLFSKNALNLSKVMLQKISLQKNSFYLLIIDNTIKNIKLFST